MNRRQAMKTAIAALSVPLVPFTPIRRVWKVLRWSGNRLHTGAMSYVLYTQEIAWEDIQEGDILCFEGMQRTYIATSRPDTNNAGAVHIQPFNLKET